MYKNYRDLLEHSEPSSETSFESIKFPAWDPFVGLYAQENSLDELVLEPEMIRRLSESKPMLFRRARHHLRRYQRTIQSGRPPRSVLLTKDGYIVEGTDDLIQMRWVANLSDDFSFDQVDCRTLKYRLDELSASEILLLSSGPFGRRNPRHAMHSRANLAFTLHWFNNNPHPQSRDKLSKAELSDYLRMSVSTVDQLITSYTWSLNFNKQYPTHPISNTMSIFIALHRKRKAFHDSGFDLKSKDELEEVMKLFNHLLSGKGREMLSSGDMTPAEISHIARKINLDSFLSEYGRNSNIIEAYAKTTDSTLIAELIPEANTILDRVLRGYPTVDVPETDKKQLKDILQNIINKIDRP